MKTFDWEPFVLFPTTFVLLFCFVALARTSDRHEQPATQVMKTQLGLSKLCSPLAVQPGQTERRWSCDQ